MWERWTRKRVFVRALEETYGELVGDLFTQLCVYSMPVPSSSPLWSSLSNSA